MVTAELSHLYVLNHLDVGSDLSFLPLEDSQKSQAPRLLSVRYLLYFFGNKKIPVSSGSLFIFLHIFLMGNLNINPGFLP